MSDRQAQREYVARVTWSINSDVSELYQRALQNPEERKLVEAEFMDLLGIHSRLGNLLNLLGSK